MRLLKTLTGSNMHMVPAVEGHDLLLCGVISENFAMYLFSPSLHIMCISTSPLSLCSHSPSLSVFLAPPSNFPSETHLYYPNMFSIILTCSPH